MMSWVIWVMMFLIFKPVGNSWNAAKATWVLWTCFTWYRDTQSFWGQGRHRFQQWFYSDFYYAIQQHSSTLVPAFFSLTTFPSLLHLCGAILSSCSFNMFFRRLPTLTPLPWGLLSGFQDYTVIARFFTKNLMFFFATQFCYSWILLAGRVNPMPVLYDSMILLSMLPTPSHNLSIFIQYSTAKSPWKLLALSPSLSPLFLSNCIKQLVPYVFTTFSCDQLLAIFLSLVPHSACSTPFCRLILDSTSRSLSSCFAAAVQLHWNLGRGPPQRNPNSTYKVPHLNSNMSSAAMPYAFWLLPQIVHTSRTLFRLFKQLIEITHSMQVQLCKVVELLLKHYLTRPVHPSQDLSSIKNQENVVNRQCGRFSFVPGSRSSCLKLSTCWKLASLLHGQSWHVCTRKSSLRSPFYWLHDEVLFYVAVSVKKISSLVWVSWRQIEGGDNEKWQRMTTVIATNLAPWY